VNGIPLQRSTYGRLVAALESDQPPVGRLVAALESDLDRATRDEERRRVLDRMIEEELLVQRGLELGLARFDRRVRADLVAAVIDSVVAEAEDREPTQVELREFYAEQSDFFARPGRQRVRQIFFRSSEGEDGAEARAAEARRRLDMGEPFAEVSRALGDPEIVVVPDALLPAAKLRQYIGPSALRATSQLGVGGVSEPVRSGGGIRLIELVAREPEHSPAFEQVEPQVRAEWRRRSGDRALRAYLDELRDRARVDISDGVGISKAEATP
jgi:hypothetical protein